MATDPEFRPTWENRRRTIFGSLAFIALGNAYVLGFVDKADFHAGHEAFVTMSLPVAAAIIGAYVFGAAWDDKNLLGSMK